MPTYAYLCKVCGHEFEAQQSIKDPPLIECPECLTCAIDRVINSEGGFLLKGRGWYKDLYSSTKKSEK